MASRKHHSPEDIVRLLQRIDELFGTSSTVELARREVSISVATYYNWRQRYDVNVGEQQPAAPRNSARVLSESARLGAVMENQWDEYVTHETERVLNMPGGDELTGVGGGARTLTLGKNSLHQVQPRS